MVMFSTQEYEQTSFENVKKTQCADCPVSIDYRPIELNRHNVSEAEGYDVVCVFVNDRCDERTISDLKLAGVNMIALRCAGYNNVDLMAADKHLMTVSNVPAYSPHAVAEYAMTCTLSLNRHMHIAVNRVKYGNFSLNGLVGFELRGRTVGVMGTGKIGQCFAHICHGFGMRVLAYDKYPEESLNSFVTYVEPDELLRNSDVVSLHLPLIPGETRHIINYNALEIMKPTAILINTSRGGLVDTNALIRALKEDKLGGAALDVYEDEAEYFFRDLSGQKTIQDDTLARLLTFNNVIVTSHQAFLTTDALHAIAETTLSNVRSFAGGNVLTKCPNTLNERP
eukprot:Clim_evm2s229 gene=Clim_evmTU2s229